MWRQDRDPQRPSTHRIGLVNLGVELFQVNTPYFTDYYNGVERTYFLQIGRCRVEVTYEQAEALRAETLPEDKLIWSVNEDPDSSFYSDLYPPWSVVPHPRGWVAGNIYYPTKKEAQQGLLKKLQRKLEEADRHVDWRLARLQLERARWEAILASEGKEVPPLPPEEMPEAPSVAGKEWLD